MAELGAQLDLGASLDLFPPLAVLMMVRPHKNAGGSALVVGGTPGTQLGPSLPSGDGGLSVQTPASGLASAADRHSPVAASISLGSVSASICEYLQMA